MLLNDPCLAPEAPVRPPIIAFAPHPWDDGPWMNRQNLLSGLARRGWPVIYSEGPRDLWCRGQASWANAPLLGHVEEMDGVRVYRAGRFPARWRKHPLWDSWVLRQHANALRRAVGAMQGKKLIAMLFEPSFVPYIEALEPTHVAFHVYDVYSRMRSWDEQDQRELDYLSGRADLITASTEGMIRSLPAAGQSRAKLLPNGADLSLFRVNSPLPCPDDLAAIPHPRISNLGTINRKMDLRLIARIASLRPHWHWVLVGKVIENELLADGEAGTGLQECRRLPNVHFLGEKSRLEVPAYMFHMDVNTVCYRIRDGEWVAAGYPVKLNEYLATGKPVVAAPQEAVCRYFSHVVAIASSEAEWLNAIEDSLSMGGVGSPADRIAVAQSNDWTHRVDVLEDSLFEVLS